MLLFGFNIQSPADELRKMQETYLYQTLRHPQPTIENMMRQLRIVYAMDVKRYAQLKRQLPYFVCGQFTPPFRRKENFAYAEAFVLDIDHLASKQYSIETVREEIIKDDRVMMCFMSPSEDGLKVLFRLGERCYDAGLYSIFYKAFAQDFAVRHNLIQVVDDRTSDVTRACFVSIDPHAYYNPECVPVSINTYIDTRNPAALFDLKYEQERLEKFSSKRMEDETFISKEPDKEIIARIRQTLNPRIKPAIERKSAYVPERLNEIIDDLRETIEHTGIEVTEIINIQYAKKIRACIGKKQAEINLFYGKRGFSVVISPRLGTDEELNNLLAAIVCQFVYEN